MPSRDPLTEATERLNTILTQSEVALREKGFGVSADVALPGGGALGFAKFDNTWRLVYTRGDVDTPLTSASRRIRIEAAAALPALYKALQAAVVDAQREVERATEQAEAFLAYLGA